VVIPHFNHGEFIAQSVNSILQQTKLPRRILIVDDASTDNSQEVLVRLAADNTLIDLVINTTRLGVNGNINRGLSLTNTRYVTFLAADDIVDSSLYETAVSCLEHHADAGACGSASHWIDESGELLPQPREIPIRHDPGFVSRAAALKWMEHYGPFLVGGGAVFRRTRLEAIGGFAESLGPYADSYALQRLAAESGVCYIPRRLAYWRRSEHGYASRTSGSAKSLAGIYATIKADIEGPRRGLFPRGYRQRLLSRWRFDIARAALGSRPRDLDTIHKTLETDIERLLLRAIVYLLPDRLAVAAAFIVLRPRDFGFAVARRLPSFSINDHAA